MTPAPILKLAACLALVVALLAGWHEVTKHYDRQGYDRAKQEDKAAAEEQEARNRDLQRKAETKYVVQAATRERFIVTTVKELAHASASLAACPVPPDVVRLLNAARDCAAGDSAAACGPDGTVPRP